jgi:hypothetical protein
MSRYVDTSRFPLVWVEVPKEITDSEIGEVLSDLRRLLDGSLPYALVFDLSGSGAINASQRKALGDHMDENREAITKRVKGLGIVANSVVARGIVTAVFWVSPPPVAHKVFASCAEAVAWAKAL